MSLPVSQYEALLAEVRGLRRKAQRVQQLARPLIGGNRQYFQNDKPLDYTMDSLLLSRQDRSNSPDFNCGSTSSDQDNLSSEGDYRLGTPRHRPPRSTGQMSVSSEPVTRVTGQVQVESLYHGAWPNVERTSMWNSEPACIGETGTHQQRKELSICNVGCQNEVASVMSFASSSGGIPIDRVLCSPERKWSSQQLEAKMDVVNSLLSMLGNQEQVDMGETLLALSTCPESCLAMRQSGCIPLLVQLVQSDKDNDTRKKASQALCNLVNSQSDEKIRKREIRVLKILEECRRYIECLKYNLEFELEASESTNSVETQEVEGDKHPVKTIAHLMKLSFDEGHRQAICQLGGIHTIASLVEIENSMHGSAMQDNHCILMRRYACMALTNLTFGDSGNKTLLCSFRDFMRALIIQLQSPSDELRQVTASVLRNLSWRADSTSKEILREVGSVTGLMKAAMLQNKENTLKSILSALWNLSAHCTENKSEICAVDGGLGFIVNMLTYKTPSKSLAIIENAGGILRNISSQIAVRDDYREILREHNCLHILLDQLKSPSLTIVSNACGTLWNLSAKNAQDQDTLWQMGAPAMLRSLNNSKHKMIAMGSSAALKNLLICRPQQNLTQKLDSTALSLNLPELPTLGARKQKSLMQDLDPTLSETYENIDKDSPVKSSIESNVDIAQLIHRNRSPEDLTNNFASLNLNEPSTSYAIDARHKSKITKNYGGSSLPYVPQPTRRSNPASFLPVRTKFSDQSYEDDTPEQPIDYSRKYSETTVDKQRSTTCGIATASDIAQNENDRTNNVLAYTEKNDTDTFNIGYTETDLDQPTDYSLRYAEDDSDSDICNKMTKQEFVQDTVKTYCTEGTPYETPFVISTATSMSDLRNVENTDEKPEIDNDIQKNNDTKDNKEIKNVEEKDRCSTEDISEMDNVQVKQQKSEFSSGMMSPEKPVNYCEEGTPGYFSRVSSFGSGLDSIPANDTVIKKEVKEEVILNESSPSTEKAEEKTNREKNTNTPKTPNEAKVVKFEQVVNYAEQTPLMFSRSSSLASLDSIEQHSIHDDRSSVVSDFSRLASGIVSPSELPDSPTQTVPSSPRSAKHKLEFPSASKPTRQSIENRQRHLQKSTVFEDNTTKFKEESTPIQFSTATSLSSLTIDDHEDNTDSPSKTPDTKVLQQLPNVSSNSQNFDEQIDQQEKKDIEKEKETSGSDDLNDDSEGDEDILAACISDGMQSNISVPTASSTPTKLPLSTFKYQPAKLQCNSTGIPMIRRTPPRHIPLRNQNLIDDAPRCYFSDTEDTTTRLSGEESNLNITTNLSVGSDNKSKAGDISDDSSNLSGDNDNMLEECIQSAMPKSKKDIKGVVPRRTMPPFKHHPPQMQPQLDQFPTPSLAQKPNEALKTTQPYNCKQRTLEKIDTEQKNRDRQETRVIRDGDRREMSLPPYLSMRDEISNYEVEDSPCHFSLRSSLSDLTVDGSVTGLKPSIKAQNPLLKDEDNVAGTSRKTLTDNCISSSKPHQLNKLHRKESLSSLSSLASNEADQALLEECIYAGMPTDKQEEALLDECIRAGMPDSGSGGATNTALEPSASCGPNTLRPFQRDDFLLQTQNAGSESSNGSKNVNVASVAGSTVVMQPPVSKQRPEMTTTAAGVEDGPALDRSDKIDIERYVSSEQAAKIQSPRPESTDARIGTLPVIDTLPGRFLHSDENFLTDQTKSGSSKSVSQFLEGSFENDFTFSSSDNCVNLDHVFTKSCEASATFVDNRMLDPDAMIESLDRFTAELVSQASHLSKDKNSQPDKQEKSKVSNDDNTWNDDSSPNELTFPSMSGSAPNVITFGSEHEESAKKDVVDGVSNQDEGIGNDFSSLNTTTMTESTLIAIEANKMVTVFKKEAEMSQSTISMKYFDLDSIKPPSQLNSLTSSVTGFEKGVPCSPKLMLRKKSLPGNLLVKRALSNPLNHSSSLESLDNNSLSNIESLNPPSEIQRLLDLENSITSIASLPREGSDAPLEFVINGVTGKMTQDSKAHPIFNVKQQFISSGLNSFNTDLELVNPPSIFNDITDMCNSLADIPTEAIGSETSIFEDCFTQLGDNTYVDNTLLNDTAEFSDANSATPIQSDFSSAESTPKRSGKPLSKNMMTKQRRNMARDRYKTYVVAAEKVMQESIELETKGKEQFNEDDNSDPLSEDYKTVNEKTENSDPFGDVSSPCATKPAKITPKERRQMHKSRFETQVLDEAVILMQTSDMAGTENVQKTKTPPFSPSPTRSKLSIRRNFMQKRLENKERFKTQTLSESSLGSPELSSASPPCDSNDIHSLVQKEANLVLKTIRDSKFLQDEMLDSETLSLVSNDEDSEHNSGSSINYKTYHRSWSLKKADIPIISTETNGQSLKGKCTPIVSQVVSSNNVLLENTHDPSSILPQEQEEITPDDYLPASDEDVSKEKVISKPKIVKPPTSTIEDSEEVEIEEQPKGIRGRRKPLYSKTNLSNKVAPKTIKPAKTMSSNLVKNVTSSIKSGTSLKNVVSSREKSTSLRPPVPIQVKSSGYGYNRTTNTTSNTPSRSIANSCSNSRNNSPKSSLRHVAKSSPPLERQGTFTKDDDSPSNSSPKTSSRLPTPPSKIPSFARQIARAVTSKIPASTNAAPTRLNMLNGQAKSVSADRMNRNTRIYNRSTSADSREPSKKIQPSSSTQSLKNELKSSNGALRKSGIPSPAQRSNSNVSVASNGSAKKQVTSKIASLWKKVEENKAKQQPSQDKRVWIQSEKETLPPKLIRSNTFENKDVNGSSIEQNDVTTETNSNSASAIPSFRED